jgi:5'-nucleotidase
LIHLKRIAIDQDQVIADLVTPWLAMYNNDYNDNLVPKDVKNWNFDNIVKESCGKKIYDYLDDSQLFRNLPVIENSQRVVRELSKNFEIFIVTSPWNSANVIPKTDWLKEHFPFLDENNFVFTKNKGIVRADYMIDDKPANLDNFSGTGLLFDVPHNQKEDRYIRLYDWLDVDRYFKFEVVR